MSGSDAIFRLVKAMTRSEKRHLKALSEIYGKNGKEYMRLFDVLDSMDIYEDEEVKAAAKELGIENLSFQKGYLMKNVLKTLRWSDKDEDSSVWAEVRDIQSLFDKRIFRDVQKRINKARSRAQEAEEFEAELMLIDLQIRYWKEVQDYKALRNGYSAMYQQKIHVLSQLQMIAKLQELHQNLFLRFIDLRTCRTAEERESLQILFDEILSSIDEKASSRTAELLLLKSRITFRTMLSEFEIATRRAEEVVRLFLDSAALRKRFRGEYYDALIDLHAYAVQANLSFDYSKEFDSIVKELKVDDRRILHSRNRLLLFLLLKETDDGNIEKANKLAAAIKKELDQNGVLLKPETRMGHHFAIARLKFLTKEYSESRLMLNNLFEDSRFNVRKDLFAVSRILNLLILVEIGDNDLLAYELRNTHSYLQRKNRKFKFEKLILSVIKHSLNKVDAVDFKNRLLSCYDDLLNLWSDENENILNHYFDFKSWIESKIDGVDLLQYIESKEKEGMAGK